MTKSYLFLILAMLFFSGNFIVGKGLSDTIPPFTLSLFRAVLGFLILSPLCYKEIYSQIPLWKKEWKPLVFIALTGIVLFNICMYSSLHYTTATNAAIVDALTPSIAAVIGYFLLRESLNKIQSIGVLISFIGVLIVVTKASMSAILSLTFNIGDIIMLAGVCVWAIYSIIIKQHGYKLPRISGVAITMLIGSIILLPFSLIEWSNGIEIDWSFSTLSSLLYVGIFPSALALLFWYRGVEDIGPAKASMFFNLVPIFTAGLAVIILGENLYFSQSIGAILIIAGVYLATKQIHPKAKLNNKEVSS